MLTSAVIYKQRLSHKNEIVQLLHNCKCYGVDQNLERKRFLKWLWSTP